MGVTSLTSGSKAFEVGFDSENDVSPYIASCEEITYNT